MTDHARSLRPKRRRPLVPSLLLSAALAAGLLSACSPESVTKKVGGEIASTVGGSATTDPSTTTGTPASGGTSSTTAAPPPYVSQARWVNASRGRSLHVFPTDAGRVAQGASANDEAWAEVVRLAPDAAQPGMRAQFDCHWTYARLLDPAKVSWNIEPWRPVVSASRMVETGCNPGGAESDEN